MTLVLLALGCGADLARSWAGYESRELDRFKVFRHMVPETINSIMAERKKQYPGIHKLGTDMAVPDGHLQEMWTLDHLSMDRQRQERR